MKNYETVFILNPVLSEDQAKDTVEKFMKVLAKAKAEVINVEQWGLKKMAYPSRISRPAFTTSLNLRQLPKTIQTLETEYRRDESVMRFLTTALDAHAVTYNARRRKGEFNKGKKTTTKRTEGVAA